jgi:homoserine O-acetyltransferase
MKTAALSLFLLPVFALAQPGVEPPRREFVIHNFHTELGATLPEAHIVYATWGTLNADKSNAILLPSHYMANYHGYDWLMGPDKALDSSKLFLVATELFGTGGRPLPAILRSRSTGRASR